MEGGRSDPREYVRAVRFRYRSRGWKWPEVEGQVVADAAKALMMARRREEWENGGKSFEGLKKGLETKMLEDWRPEGSRRARMAKRAIAFVALRTLMRGKGVSELLENQVSVTDDAVEIIKMFHKTASRRGGGKKIVFKRREGEGEGEGEVNVAEALGKWLRLRDKLLMEGELKGARLFAWPIEKKSGKIRWVPLNTSGVAKLAKEIARQATGSGMGFAAHSFRRGGARALCAAGVPLDRIMLEGGWKSVQALSHYIQEPLRLEQSNALTKA